jgi:hypothetical protein
VKCVRGQRTAAEHLAPEKGKRFVVKRRLAVVVATVLVSLGFPAPAAWADSLAEREADYLSALRTGRAPTVSHVLRRPGDSTCSGAASGLPVLLPASLRSPQAQALGNAGAEVGIHLRPVVVDRALLDEALHTLA